jgi:hypothetical protein
MKCFEVVALCASTKPTRARSPIRQGMDREILSAEQPYASKRRAMTNDGKIRMHP